MNPYAIFFGIVLLLFLVSGVAFEVLVCRLFTNHPVEWQRFGSPASICDARITHVFYGSIAKMRVARSWPFRKPSWVRGDRFAETIYQTYRWSYLVALGGCIGFVIWALLSS